jgi:hypothetical protein
MKWTNIKTPTYDGWNAERTSKHGVRRVARVSLSKMSGLPRIRYGVSVEAWTNLNKTKEQGRTLPTYKEAKKVANQYRKEVEQMWG